MSVWRSPYNIAEWVLCLVRDAMVAANRDPLSRTFVGTGVSAWDDCCGSLIVVPERIYRSDSFPDEKSGEEYCIGGDITLNLLVVLLRCVPTLDDRGYAPTAHELDDAHKRILEDAGVVWNAIVCADLPDGWERAAVSQNYVGAEGGCLGIETRLIIGLEQSRWSVA